MFHHSENPGKFFMLKQGFWKRFGWTMGWNLTPTVTSQWSIEGGLYISVLDLSFDVVPHFLMFSQLGVEAVH